MSSTSIIQSCPCCDAELVIDLATGDLEALNSECIQAVQTNEVHSGIKVQHVTPEYHHRYIDPTHYKMGYPIAPNISPTGSPLQDPHIDDSEYFYGESDPADEETIDKTTIAHQQDLKRRGII